MTAVLEHRSWWLLWGLAHALNLKFPTRQTRQQAHQQLREQLVGSNPALRRVYRALSPAERDILLGLRAQGGVVSFHTFTTSFGDIRPYKPWRADALLHPWKRPISVAEKLWHLALIEIVPAREGCPAQVALPDEVAAWLPQPVPPKAMAIPMDQTAARDLFVRDLVAFLGGLRALNTPLKCGRWLTPTQQRSLNVRLAVPDPAAGARTAFATGRLRFLHYAAVACGWVEGTHLTPAAWAWLHTPERWRAVFNGIEADINQRGERLWDQFRLPACTPDAWRAVVSLLNICEPGRSYRLSGLQNRLRFALEKRDTYHLLTTVFTWLSWVRVEANRVTVYPPAVEHVQPATPALQGESLLFQLSVSAFALPPLHAWVEVAGWADVASASALRVDGDTVRRALEKGLSLLQIRDALARLCGGQMDDAYAEQINRWAEVARRITLQPIVLLTLRDQAAVHVLRADRRIRPLLGESLSPHHLAVRAENVSRLRQMLARRGWETLLTDGSATFAPHALPANKPPNFPDCLPADPTSVRAQVEHARSAGHALTICYCSLYEDAPTTRTIEPGLIYERGGLVYFEAWCRLAEDMRTFRLDRVVQILPET